MANTYTLISSNVLSSSAASVTFSSIPSTYTDLVLKISGRTDRSATVGNATDLSIVFDSTNYYSATTLYGVAGITGSGRNNTNDTLLRNIIRLTLLQSTANTFSSAELYIARYTTTDSKPISSISAWEQNDSTNYEVRAGANIYTAASPITTMTLTPSGGNFISGSSFYLYGIKNS